ncbi:hypothetical protein BB561_001423 [Smittium simulii]|uniref:CBS domain-containing protein n=1 Tax=Smittium simulii TaxID=133385 RepID=A0A2T9YUN1_9FUNG|nr:hypothetical protein BB561_001423 [Smittium simulii]
MRLVKNLVGNTPVLNISELDFLRQESDGNINIIAKLEFMNPGSSVKDRAAKAVFNKLDESGLLKNNSNLLIPTSGNLGISLSMLNDNKTSNKIICAIPEKSSYDKIQILKTSGAIEIIRTLDYALPFTKESPQGVCNSLLKLYPDSLIIDEESKTLGFEDCYSELAQELISQCQDGIDCIVVPVETGNLITQLSKILKQAFPKIHVIGVEPVGSVFSMAGVEPQSNMEKWIADSYGNVHIPKSLDLTTVDEWIQVSDQNAFCTARSLISNGIFCGITSGAAIYATKSFIQKQKSNFKKKTNIVVLFPDSSNFYTSTLLNDEYILSSGLANAKLSSKLYESLFDRYRAASVEDLQLSAAISIQESSNLGSVLNLMVENDFSHVPVTTTSKKLVGYISKSAVETLLSLNCAALSDLVGLHMHSFTKKPNKTINLTLDSSRNVSPKPKSAKYTIITPETPLSELAKFFDHHNVAFVTDISCKFCLGVVTKNDLMQFIEKRQFVNIY